MSETIFSKILSGEAEASFVYQDELVSAFLDIQPVNPGHTLVIPNRRASFLKDLDEKTAARLFKVARIVGEALRGCGLKCDGVNILLADGEAAGQEVFHTHLHVIPRFSQDGFGFKFADSYFQLPERAELDAVAEKIRKAL